MTIEFYKGMTLDINEECLGTVTEVADDRIFIDSRCFRGWATKAEISEAMESLTKAEQSPRAPPLHPAFVG
jgi:hypothetical protein